MTASRSKTAAIALPFVLFCTIVDAQIQFAPGQNVAVGTIPSKAALVDFDGDGRRDVIVLDDFNKDVHLLPNDGAGGFATALSRHFDAPSANFTALTHFAVAFDGDGDGDDDVFASASPYGSIVENHGDGTLGRFPTSSYPFGGVFALSDMDGDGDLDVVAGDFNVSIYYSQGGGVWVPGPQVFNIGISTPSVLHILVSDLDADGDKDVVVARNGTNQFPIRTFQYCYNEPTGWNQVFGGVWSGIVAVGDLDGDGDDDYSNGVHLVFNDGSGFNSPSALLDFHATTTSIQFADLDQDGDLDIVATVSSDGFEKVALKENLGAGLFAPPRYFGVDGTPRGVGVGDLDGDGLLDLIACNGTSGSITILRQVAGIPATATRSMTIVSGDQQSVNEGVIAAAPLVVHVADSLGTPIVGAIVEFRGTLAPYASGIESVGPRDVTTDANGNASVVVRALSCNCVGSTFPRYVTAFSEGATAVRFSINVVLDASNSLSYPLMSLQTFAVPPASVMNGATYPQPWVVRVVDPTSQPVPGVAVTVRATGGAVLASPPVQMADSNGLVSITAIAGLGGSRQRLTASILDGAISRAIDIRADGLRSSWNPASRIWAVELVYPQTHVFFLDTTPRFVLAADVPLPSPGFVTTLLGPLYTSLLSPSPQLVLLDGIGFTPTPRFDLVVDHDAVLATNIPPSVSGVTIVVQACLYDPSKIYPLCWFISNPVFQTF